jgi:serine/threonine protein phosphatase PrpC
MQPEFYFSHSIKKPIKAKCGDASFSGKMQILEDTYIVLIVADGVSKAAKDWLASATTVRLLQNYLSSLIEPNITEQLAKAIALTNLDILSGIEDTIGMKSTLCVLLYNEKNEKVYFANIGDSRIYGFDNNQSWKQLSADDVHTQVYKENGKTIMHNGQPIMRSTLSQCIGGGNTLSIKVQKLDTHKYKGFCLMSDGFYSLLDFEKIITNLYHAPEMKQLINTIEFDILNAIDDDASVAILRIILEKMQIEQLQQENNNNYSKAMLLHAVLPDLYDKIAQQNETDIIQLLEWMVQHHIYLSKENMIELLEKMITTNCSLSVQKIKEIIRKL